MLNVGWKFNAQPRRLLTFELGGKARLAPSPPRDMTVHALDDPSIEIDEADIAPGRDGYTMMCSACHGIRLSSPGAPGPDLRERSEAHTSALQSLMRISNAVICLQKKKEIQHST